MSTVHIHMALEQSSPMAVKLYKQQTVGWKYMSSISHSGATGKKPSGLCLKWGISSLATNSANIFQLQFMERKHAVVVVWRDIRETAIFAYYWGPELEEEGFESDYIFKRSLELIKHHSMEHWLGAYIMNIFVCE